MQRCIIHERPVKIDRTLVISGETMFERTYDTLDPWIEILKVVRIEGEDGTASEAICHGLISYRFFYFLISPDVHVVLSFGEAYGAHMYAQSETVLRGKSRIRQ